MTPPLVAAQLLYQIYLNENVEEMVVAELGVGTGMIIAGLIFIGAYHSLGVEIDQKYVRVAQRQLQEKVEGASYELIQGDVAQLRLKTKMVDLVVMNPPFGTKQEGIDAKFLEVAMTICSGPIYSMHKSSTRGFLQKFAEHHSYKFELIMEVSFPLKKRFKGYHKKEMAFTQVDVIKLTPLPVPEKKKTEK